MHIVVRLKNVGHRRQRGVWIVPSFSGRDDVDVVVLAKNFEKRLKPEIVERENLRADDGDDIARVQTFAELHQRIRL